MLKLLVPKPPLMSLTLVQEFLAVRQMRQAHQLANTGEI
jgi:hypothetical protein